MKTAHGNHGSDARETAERRGLLRCGIDENRIEQMLDRSGDMDGLRFQTRAQVALHVAQMLSILAGDGAGLFDAAGKALDHRLVGQHQHPFMGRQRSRRQGAGNRQREEEQGTRSKHGF